jgi:hypothetical protein
MFAKGDASTLFLPVSPVAANILLNELLPAFGDGAL